MTALVLGSGGQLGSLLVHALEAENYWVTGVEQTRLDITDEKAVRSLAAMYEPDVIVNCAAFTDVDGCEKNPDLAMRVNALGAGNAARAAQMAGAKLVHISTGYVFPGTGNEPLREWDTPAPRSVYGKSKLLGEELVRQNCPHSFILRTAWLYGSAGSFVESILRAALQRDHIRVVEDQTGSPTNALDLCRHIAKLCPTQHYGLYHCAGKGACSRYDFAREIVELAGIPCRVEPCRTEEFPRPAPRPAYAALDNCLLRCTVGDNMRPWREALREYMNTQKTGGETP